MSGYKSHLKTERFRLLYSQGRNHTLRLKERAGWGEGAPITVFQCVFRCYVYVNPRRNITWFEANMACREKYGGHLASFNTPTEWNSVILAMQLSTSYTPYFVGLKTIDSGKPHM